MSPLVSLAVIAVMAVCLDLLACRSDRKAGRR